MTPRSVRRPHSRGFTLIELLVVIAIIAILIGLLLPAVQKVREAAARSKCSNNIKQLAIAVHSYHDANNKFPASGPQATYNNSGANWSWEAQILPYIEQGPLYTLGGLGSSPPPAFNANANVAAMMAARVPTFICPSDPDSNKGLRTDCADIGAGPTGLGVGVTNYKGVCGNNWAWGTYNIGGSPTNNGLDQGNGIFYRTDGIPNTSGHGPLTMTSILDGTSNTLMIGEDLVAINRWLAWPYANAVTGTCAIPLNNALRAGQPGYNNSADWPDVYSFRSRHSGGANFGLADGSVRYVRDSIDITQYRYAATYAGGEVSSLD